MHFDTLTEAIRAGDPAAVREHLDAGADPNALHVVLDQEENFMVQAWNRIDITELRNVMNGFDEDVYEHLKQSMTGLLHQHDRLKENQPEIIRTLLEAGADVNLTDRESNAPLHLAIRGHAKPEVIHTLLDGGADVNLPDRDGDTPLHLSMLGRFQPEVVQALLDHGADVNVCNARGNSVLHIAITEHVLPDVIGSLLAAGIDVNLPDQEGDTPLHLAMREGGEPSLVQSLLDAGADVHALNQRDLSPLDQLVEMEDQNVRPECVRALIQHGAQVLPDMACWVASEGHSRSVGFLLDNGVDVNLRDDQGKTMLHHVAHQSYFSPDHEGTMRTLLKRGADPTLTDHEGHTPSDLATMQGNLEIVTVLGAARRQRESQEKRPERSRLRERSRS